MRVKDTTFDLNKFIELIKARRPIYAVDSRDHHNRLIVDSLWSEVSQEMQKSVIECKTKWHQLRNNFARELRREKLHCRRSIWYLRKPLNFLREHILRSRPKKYSEHDSEGTEPSKKYFEENATKIENADNSRSDETYSETIAYEDYGSFEENLQEVESYDQNQKVDATPSQQYCQESQEVGKTDDKEEINRYDEKSADMSFFQSLFPDIHKLSSRRKRKFKETVLISLNRLLDEEEEEEQNGYRLTYETIQ